MKKILTLIAVALLSSCTPLSQSSNTYYSQPSFTPSQTPTIRYLNLNLGNASNYLRVNIQLNNSIGELTTLLTASANVWFTTSNLSQFNLGHSNGSNIQFSGTMRFDYSYFLNNSFRTGSKTINISGTLYKSNSFTNSNRFSTLISVTGASQINGVSNVSVNISSMSGTLVYR
jgi:hypothetical protein